MMISGAAMMRQLEALAAFSEDTRRLTRTYLTAPHRAAAEQIKAWMAEAGMSTEIDSIGNVVGRYPALQADQPALLLGSHFDTVRNAGRYDGAYGIIAAIACVRALHESDQRLPFALEVIGFADEEGARFNATLLGSRAIAGCFDRALLQRTDAAGQSMADALRSSDLDPDGIDALARHRDQVLAFVELHIEQGPVLLSEDLPVGIVTAIAGATRLFVTVNGLAGHAGTVPMSLRRDAAAAAAEALLFVEQVCGGDGVGLVGTVGQFEVPEGATNVVPGCARFSVDVRAGDDLLRNATIDRITRQFDTIASRRRVNFDIETTHDAPAAVCASWLMEQLEAAVRRQGVAPRRLLSGAGHDAMAVAALTDIAMLFVRCGNGGISHHPDETMTAEDARTGAAVLLDFIRAFKPREGH